MIPTETPMPIVIFVDCGMPEEAEVDLDTVSGVLDGVPGNEVGVLSSLIAVEKEMELGTEAGTDDEKPLAVT